MWMKTHLLSASLGLILVAGNAAFSSDTTLETFEGKWRLVAMTNNGIEVPDENLKQTEVSIADGQLILDKFWHLACKNPIDPVTKTAEGYLEGYPGLSYALAITSSREPGEIDLTVNGIVPAEDEADLDEEIKAAIRNRIIRAKGIYSLNQDKLTICWHEWSLASGTVRPTDFTAKPNSDRVLLVLQREKAK